jgi:ABC-type branched-subunit amino acid transport system ATPase component
MLSWNDGAAFRNSEAMFLFQCLILADGASHSVTSQGGYRGCLAFAEMLKVNTSVLLLDLADNGLGESGVETSSDFIKALVSHIASHILC